MKNNQEDIIHLIQEMALNDSQAALKSIYLLYYERLMRLAGMYVTSSLEAEEIVSDTFFMLWKNRKNLLNITNFNSYIYGITYHKSIDNYRKQIRKGVNSSISFEDVPLDLFIATETTPEESLIDKENIERLNIAINELPQKCKIAFKLIREDGLKYKEAATILGISIKTLEAHLANAVKKLREAIEFQK